MVESKEQKNQRAGIKRARIKEQRIKEAIKEKDKEDSGCLGNRN